MSITWKDLGSGYPGESPFARAVFDAVAPVIQGGPIRVPGVDLGTELAISPEEDWNLALRGLNAVLEHIVLEIKESSLNPARSSGSLRHGPKRCTSKNP